MISRRSLPVLPIGLGLFDARAAVAGTGAMAAIEQRRGGRLGVFALDTGTGRVCAHRAEERFLMCSTFKGLLAAQVLARIEGGLERPDRLLPYGARDLIFTSPVTKAHLGRGGLSVEDLCRAMVEVSDNTASVLLMRASGGPAALTRFLRGLGDETTRMDRYEPQANEPSGDFDTTSPRAVVTSIRAILLGSALGAAAQAKLEGWMVACTPGRRRLRAALPPDWVAGDRPGTSLSRQTNDYAIIRPPERAPLLVAAYYDAPGVGLDAREAALREVGAAIVEWAR
ncbi:class A beta-lactamase [Roseococcus pinisoli]|uniref:Beta-lactamase n=1 Tax=Roseococcus pinisoli TaxID=2835040 RepID=A0ABS5Q8M6_9PROT|nr:class A beta-lactamase [Roseococcus pinisoli]MBS7809753.1 class A beta-lactamase [Roseococcus pinisoli]